ncbi:MAG: hypothetical protein HXY39_09775 [Chloroflexi bacterium]|nr:hypothetical protein [Chloroflexota bacterium]
MTVTCRARSDVPAPTRPVRATIRALAARALSATGLFALFTTLFAFVQFGTAGLADNDGFYHMRMARLMLEEGLTPRFVWLPSSILNADSFYDHHFLYHAYLAMFAGNPDDDALIMGAKLASIMMPALAFVAIWWLLRAEDVPWAWIWALGLFGISEAFLYRMSMPRAQSASLLVLALSLHVLLQRRYHWLLPLGFLYVWLYNAFPLLLMLGGATFLATIVTDRRIEWRALLFPVAGIVLGLLINPYVPENLIFIANHLAPKIGQPETSVGNEWYPYQTWTLVGNSGGALAAWLLGTFAIGWRGSRMDRSTLIAFGLSVFFGILLFKSRRFVEYFPPFALIFAALACAPLLRSWRIAALERHDASLRQHWRMGARRYGIPVAFAIVIGVLATLTLPAARAQMADSRPAETYAGASAWLRAHAYPGTMVFQTDWDDFPRLFFYNTASRYTIGLDPTYMQLYDPDLYDEWVAITRGKVSEPGARIAERFGAQYVVTDHAHGAFLRAIEGDPHLREVYRDTDAIVFVVVQ